MSTLRLNDLVRGAVEELTIDLTASASDALAVVITDLGLPRFDLDGTPLTYALRSAESGQMLGESVSLADAGVDAGSTVELVSPAGSEVWEQVRDLTVQLRQEIDAGLRRGRAGVRSALQAEGERLEGTVRREVQGMLRGATQDIEAEVSRRLRRVGRHLGLFARRRVRRLTRQLQATGALPSEVEALSLATGQLRSVAQSALVVPLAGVAAAGVVVGGGGLYLGATSDGPDVDGLRERIEQVELVAAGAKTTAEAAAVSAEGAAQVAASARDLANEHVAARADPHEILVLETVGTHVLAQLQGEQFGEAPETPAQGADGAAGHGWVGAILAAADVRADSRIDTRIDTHLSTAYAATPGSGATVENGDSLWSIATDALGRRPGRDHGCEDFDPISEPAISQVVDYVSRLWIANVGVIRDDAGALEVGARLQLVCPSPAS